MVMSRADSVVKRSDAFVVGRAGVLHLEQKQTMQGAQGGSCFSAVRQAPFPEPGSSRQSKSAESEFKPLRVTDSERDGGDRLSPDRSAEHPRSPSAHSSWKSLTSCS